jgi:putative molybdopterin biosynthesis protein
MGEKNKAEPASNIQNRLRERRTAKGLSQGDVGRMAGITRQAVYAIENHQYLPTTAVALRLAGVLGCRVEDLFSLISIGEVLEGELITGHPATPRTRVKIAHVGKRWLVRPVSELGGVLNFTIPADGLIVGSTSSKKTGALDHVRIELLRDRRLIEEEIMVAGCDPAIFLAGDHLRRRQEKGGVIGWTMGSGAAIEALNRGEVHVAGLHVVDAKSGESNLPYLRRHLKGRDHTVVTFAAWEQGMMVQRGNPKSVREVADLARKEITIVNREEGSGARLLLDRKLTEAGMKPAQVRGYGRLAGSHLEAARMVAERQAYAAIGVLSAARLFGLDFLPLQEERYDLVVPTPYLTSSPALSGFLDTLVSRAFRTEVQALGGYDTRDSGKVQDLYGKPVSH